MPSVSTILGLAPVACVLAYNDVDRGALFGARVDPKLPIKIYATYRVIKKIYDYSPVTAPVNATGHDQINAIGNNGDNIEVFVNDPILGSILLGSYTKVSGDTDTTILATHIASALNSNAFGYYVTSSTNTISITARLGLGSAINGGGRLTAIGNTTSENPAKVILLPALVSTGTVFFVMVADPISGTITIATYTQQVTDTTNDILISNLISTINAGVSGYSALPYSTTGLYIYARPGLGSTINGNAGTISWGSSSTGNFFFGGINAVNVIPNTVTQFSGGVTGVGYSTALIATSNYLWELMGMWGILAMAYGGGTPGQVTPVTPIVPYIYPFMITSSDFEADGKTYINNGIQLLDNLSLFINEFSNQWLVQGAETFSRTSTGFIINIPGFDANTQTWDIMVQKLNS